MSTEPPNPQETQAQAPFDDLRADLILQSSDRVHFRVFKIVLSLASPIFADMFSIPSPVSPNPRHGDNIQVVPLTEDSEALDLSLRHIYPVQTPDVVPLRDASILAEFARKYQVDALGRFITRYLTENVEHDPVGVYAIAVTYGYRGIGAKAARSCLTLPFSRLQSPHLQGATAVLFGELLRYHVACGEAASNVASERAWFSSLNTRSKFISTRKGYCPSCSTQDFILDRTSSSTTLNGINLGLDDDGSQVKRYGPLCLWNFLHRSALILARHPTAKAISAEDFVMKGCDCISCPSDTRLHILEFRRVFVREIEKAVERVPLPGAVAARGTE
ncbi:hypothetical protein BJV74DRAFT_884279 [Russula compacta]|nr:hypothetical protein BJV74DRAFT_884279 [Russula compacta]